MSVIHEQTGTYRDYSIIVHCHLCWDWVWQRPQQFLSRLSSRHPILFVETHAPSKSLDEPKVQLKSTQFPNLQVLQIQFPTVRWHDGDYVDAERRRLVQRALSYYSLEHFKNPVQWFYDPMAVTAFAGALNERATVYDCMDELSQFRGAPPNLVEREKQLLEIADVVFTGGRKLFQSKSRHNSNCHFYGCGVDIKHFGQAMLPTTSIPDDIANLPAPRLGYFGVIDERIDYDLLAKLAEKNPTWSVIMVGPTAKVDPKSLPRRANLHWLGGRPYSQLPGYTRAFDVCLMPFALNEATEYINPTKALEYMASGKPIVSTAVPDVVSNFDSVVEVAHSPHEFVSLCQKAAASPNQGRIQKGLQMAQENTWESIVSRLERHIHDVLVSKAARNVHDETLKTSLAKPTQPPHRVTGRPERSRCSIT